MGVTGDGALIFGPAHDGRGPCGPAFAFCAVGSRISLVLEVEKADMPQSLRAEAADLEIVFHHGERAAELMDGGREESALIIVTGTPGEHAADIERFATDLQEHVLGFHTFGGACVMRATGAVDVVIARVKTKFHRVYPTFEFYRDFVGAGFGDVDLLVEAFVFGAAGVFQIKFAGWDENGVAIVAVDVGLEIKIGSEAFGLRRKNVASAIAEGEASGGRFVVVIENSQAHWNGGADIEENWNLTAKTEILVAAANFKTDCGFAFAGLAAVDERDGVFDVETRKFGAHRRDGVHGKFKKTSRRSYF